MLIRITGRIRGIDFCAGIIKGDCAPILRRHLRGLTVAQIRAYCKKKGWTFELL